MFPRIRKMQAATQTMASREHLSKRARRLTRNAGTVLVFLLGACFTHLPRGAFAHEYAPPVSEFNTAACYGLVAEAGRAIAWARWEQRLPLEKTRSAPFRANTPAWVIDLVQGWVDDAYVWRASNEQIQQWAAELGSVDSLPSADALSVHETIAIWMRRIGRQCNERNVHAAASAQLIGADISPRR